MRNSQPTEDPFSPLSARPATLRYSPVSTACNSVLYHPLGMGWGFRVPGYQIDLGPHQRLHSAWRQHVLGLYSAVYVVQSAHWGKDDNPGCYIGTVGFHVTPPAIYSGKAQHSKTVPYSFLSFNMIYIQT